MTNSINRLKFPQQRRLFDWLRAEQCALQGLTRVEIAHRAEASLGFPVTDVNVITLIDGSEGEIRIPSRRIPDKLDVPAELERLRRDNAVLAKVIRQLCEKLAIVPPSHFTAMLNGEDHPQRELIN